MAPPALKTDDYAPMTIVTTKNTLLACFLWLLTFASLAYSADIYVSPGGNDTHSGLGPGDDMALRTLQAAANRLRPGDTCWVLAGTYRETITFPCSERTGQMITVKPYRDAQVIVSGCDPISDWGPEHNGIWKAPMPWTLGTGRNQVFCGDRVLVEARYPNEPAPGLEIPVSGLSPLWPTFGEFSISEPATHPDRLVSRLLEGQPEDYWKGALYYGVHYEGWCGQTGIVERSEPGAIVVGDRTQGWWHASEQGHKLGLEDGRGMIVGHLHALDQPGEWHWQDNTLYFIPVTADSPSHVEAKRRQLAFDLSGCEYLRIEGITVHGASLRLDQSAHCEIDRCRCEYISHFTRQYGMGQVEHGRDTIKSGETGIYVSGHDNVFTNCTVQFSAGAGFHLRGYHHTIHNCLIDQVSYTSHYLNAITDAVGDYNDYENFLVGGHVITYNTMCNAGRHFFNFYGNGTSLASRTRGPMDYMATLFAHNHLFNGMLETRDAGFLTGYYGSGGTLDGIHSLVACNVLHDSYDPSAMRWGKLGIVYLDAGTCDVDLDRNLLWAAPGSLQRGMWFNTCCVGIRRRKNVFHPEFGRTCAELTAEDFPEGQPYRFGHDFQHPPALLAWPPLDEIQLSPAHPPVIEAGNTPPPSGKLELHGGDTICLGEVDWDRTWRSATLNFASGRTDLNSDRTARAAPRHRHATDPLIMEAVAHDAAEQHIRKQWTFVHGVQDGAWLRFNQVPLGEGYRRLRVVYGNQGSQESRVEVRLDRVDGPLVANATLPVTDLPRGGHVQVYGEVTCQLAAAASGTRDVFYVFHGPPGQPVAELEYFRFEQYRGELPLQNSEVQLQLRLGSAGTPDRPVLPSHNRLARPIS